ncbi:DUF4340 domain-containing protein [Nitrosomonas sp. Nm84]|uniref:DUF4340 domain-containing protein n=1 Tax=Nitrosomonas sp. Nm84 TaxID=200124 RepID=UPI000D76B7A4|nr:DUF4340 domain-containing protein [Nitrosomonas sp. Nm84]
MTHPARLNLIMFATIVGLMVFLYSKPQIQGVQEYPISSAVMEDVQTVRIIRQQKEMILKRLDHRWYLIKPVQAQADEEKIKEILKILTATSDQRFPATDLGRFGLDRPGVQLYFDDEYVGFGGFAPVTQQQYVMTNDLVYLVAPRYVLALPLSASDLINPRLLASNEIPMRLELSHLSVEFKNGNWNSIIQDSGQTLDTKTIEHWVHLWQTAYARELTFEQQLSDDLVEVGDIKISLKNEQKIVLRILQSETEVVFLRADGGIGYHFPVDAGRQLLDPYAIKLSQAVSQWSTKS